MDYKFIRIEGYPSDLHKLQALGAFLGQYAHLQHYYEAVATQEAIDRIRRHGFNIFDGEVMTQ